MKKLFAIILSLGLILAPIPAVNTAHAAGGGYAKMILGLANGIVGSTIITNCKDVPSMTFDHYIYMAGSLVYIAGEILTGKQKGADIGSQQKAADECKAKMKEGGDYQKCTLEAQKKDEESTKAFIEKKIKWTTATLVVYSLAAVATGVEIVCENIIMCKPVMDSMLTCTPNPGAATAVQIGVVAAFGYASGGLLGAAMAGGMKAFGSQLGIGTGIVSKMVSAMSTGYYRLGFYIAAGVLVGVILGDLKKQKQESEKRIAEIQKVIDSLEKADNNLIEGQSTSGSSVKPGELAGGVNGNGPRQFDVTSLAAGTQVAKHCWSGSTSSTTNFSEAGCNQPIRLTKPTFPPGVNIPTLTDGTGAAIDMSNAVSSGDLAAADIQAGKLASMAGRVGKLKDELIGKINADLVKNGKKPIDGKDILKQQVDSFNDALNKQNPGSGNIRLADLQNAGEAAISETIPASEVPASTTVPSAAPADASTVAGIDLSSLESDLAGTEAVDPNAANANEKVASLEDSLNQYESNESDIAQDTGVSIFKQVSNRYFLNYTKIFEKKKIADPPMAPQPANP